MSKALGVDFGSGFSFVSVFDGNECRPLVSRDCPAGIPSLVYYSKDTNIMLYGASAFNAGLNNSAGLARDFKRNIDLKTLTLDGKEFNNADVVKGLIKYIVDNSYNILDNTLLPISRENQTDECINAVFTYPVSLDKGRGQILRDIVDSGITVKTFNGEKKLNIIGTIQEPYAAGLYYLNSVAQNNGTVLIYDLGSGTFDCAVVKIEIKDSDIKKYDLGIDDAIEGLSIGGFDFDKKLEEIVLKKLEADNNLLNPNMIETFRSDIVNLKHSLTNDIAIPFSSNAFVNHSSYLVTREEFENATKGLVDDTIAVVDKQIDKCRKNGIVIDDIILVGGASNMPMVRSSLVAKYPNYEFRSFNPSEAISYGAAYYGDIKLKALAINRVNNIGGLGDTDVEENVSSVKLHLSSNYGTDVILSGEKYVEVLLEKGTEIPCVSRKKTYYPHTSTQPNVSISVYQCDNTSHGINDAGSLHIPEKDCDMFKYGSYVLKNANLAKDSGFLYRIEIDENEYVTVHIKEGNNDEMVELSFSLKDQAGTVSKPKEQNSFNSGSSVNVFGDAPTLTR